MTLSFLAPWLLLGAVAIGAPIWLHLRRKQETHLLRFSTLRFLDDNPHPNKSPMRLRDVLLFALRVLALLAVVTAFAWPYLRDANLPVVRESRVYILDNTMSHQASSAFERARARVFDDLGRAGSDVQVAVVELTSQPRVVASFGEGRDTARQRVRDLTPSHQRGSYLAAFRQANTLLANSLGERKRVVFFGDHQENQWTENVNTPPFLRRVEVEMAKPLATNAPNLALSEPRLQRVFLGDKSLVNFTAKLTHAGAAPAAVVSLRANGQTIFRRTVDLVKQPETILLQAQWEADPALWLQGDISVEGEPDALPADDRCYFTLPPVREGRVALLAQSPYLRVALLPDIMRGHWSTRALEATKLDAELTASSDAEVLVIESSYLHSADARKLVWRYLTNQRGVILLVNRVTPAVSAALRELGFEVVGGASSGRERTEKFQFVLSNHAIFHPFLSPEYGNLLEVRVARHERLKALHGVPLVFGESGDPLFFQGTKHPGRLFVAAFGFERDQTSWPRHVTFIPFLDLCLQNARPEDATPANYEPGEVGILQFPVDTPVREVALREGPRELARVPVVQGRAQLRLPDQPGLFAVTHDAEAEPQRIFSVNPSPKESRLTYVTSPDALKLWQFPADAEAPPSLAVPSPAQLSRAAILQQRIWWWLLAGGLGALLIETVWTAAVRRRESESAET